MPVFHQFDVVLTRLILYLHYLSKKVNIMIRFLNRIPLIVPKKTISRGKLCSNHAPRAI